jgi:DNA (cytosine-5)-methyltransferase 1
VSFALSWAPKQPGIILDLFAGPGGWSEGLRMIGLADVGLEWDEAACKTRAAAGHTSVRVDVSCFVLGPLLGRVWGAIFSPPCTKFSAAGKQFGLKVMGLLAEGIQRMFRGDDCRQELRDQIYPAALAEQETANAKRRKPWTRDKVEAAARDDAFVTVLVLEPARYLHALIAADVKGAIPLEWAAFEQVPGVLPLWKVYAEELRRLGWSVWTGTLNAANYGVPQTRERAVLIASSVRRVTAPDATHDKNPAHDLFGDCLKPWVSMADAIGWGMTHRPALTVAVGTAAGGPDPSCVGGSGARATLYGERDAGRWIACRRIVDAADLPAYRGGRRDTIRVTPEDAALLQTFPGGHPFQGSQTKRYEQIGNAVPCLLAEHVIATAFGIPMSQTTAAAA